MTCRILTGDCREALRSLPGESVHCVVTSPPYWGLRSYEGGAGMIGLEADFEAHAEALVEVFREVRRVLRADGTLWLNYGDRYAGAGSGAEGLDSKDLMLLPARVALALQADGWRLRSEIVWHKTNPMPGSAPDRPVSAHEKLFLLARSDANTFWTHPSRPGTRFAPDPDYLYVRREGAAAAEATPREPAGWRAHPDWSRRNLWRGHHYFYDAAAVRSPGSPNARARRKDGIMKPAKGADPRDRRGSGWRRPRTVAEQAARGTNLRDVWSIPVHGFPGAHFATFPPDLVEPCVLAGTSEAGACPECGAPWARQTRVSYRAHRPSAGRDPRSRGQDKQAQGSPSGPGGWRGNNFLKDVETTGWAPTCGCEAGKPVPAVVLDPFGGAGTTGLVAERLGRDSLLIEISPEYAALARKRITADAPLLAEVEAA